MESFFSGEQSSVFQTPGQGDQHQQGYNPHEAHHDAGHHQFKHHGQAHPDPQQQETLLKMIDKLEELDDVQNVYHNAVITIQDEEED